MSSLKSPNCLENFHLCLEICFLFQLYVNFFLVYKHFNARRLLLRLFSWPIRPPSLNDTTRFVDVPSFWTPEPSALHSSTHIIHKGTLKRERECRNELSNLTHHIMCAWGESLENVPNGFKKKNSNLTFLVDAGFVLSLADPSRLFSDHFPQSKIQHSGAFKYLISVCIPRFPYCIFGPAVNNKMHFISDKSVFCHNPT